MTHYNKSQLFSVHDSNAKLPSGILQGNVNQFGDFDQCLESSSPQGKVQGRYCLTHIQILLPDDFKLLRYLKEEMIMMDVFKSTLKDVRVKVF